MNIRDERTVGEQVKSGVRLAGWVLLTSAFIYALLGDKYKHSLYEPLSVHRA